MRVGPTRRSLKRPPVVADRVIGQPLRWYQIFWDGGGGDYTGGGWYHDDEDDPTPKSGDTACLWRVTPGGEVIYWWDQTSETYLNDIAFGDGRVWVAGHDSKVWVGQRGSFADPFDLGVGGGYQVQRIAFGDWPCYINEYGWGRFDRAGATAWTVSSAGHASPRMVVAVGDAMYALYNGGFDYIEKRSGDGTDLGNVAGSTDGVSVICANGADGLYLGDSEDYRIRRRNAWDSSTNAWSTLWLTGSTLRPVFQDLRATGDYVYATAMRGSDGRCGVLAAADGSVVTQFTPDFGAAMPLTCDGDAAGNVYVAGVYGLAKYAADGTKAWQLDGVSGYRVRLDDDGCAWVVGGRRYFDGTDWIAVP